MKEKKLFPMGYKYARVVLVLFIVFLNISCDQASKHKARINIEFNQKIPVISSVFYLTKAENTGGMLSFGSNLPKFWRTILLTYLPLLALLISLFYLLANTKIKATDLIGYCFVIGGGFGNMIDRTLYGSVTDFMNLGVGSLRTGIFNMADVSIMVGLGVILLGPIQKKWFSRQKLLAGSTSQDVK